MGLRNVRREPVPVDVFEFKKASVAVGSREMICSAFAGVQPTPEGGITADVVYIKGGTAADFDAAGDVSGKIVLVDNLPSSWWPSIPAFEAGYRKAAGVILTFTSKDPRYYSFHSQELGAFDIGGDLSIPPVVYLCRQDGDWLKSRLTLGEVRATMVLDQKVTFAQDGGVGYNVVGELRGSSSDGQSILLLAHQDAHFKGAVDDTAGFVNMLTIAKAMVDSKYRPRHTVVFMATCAEEFGHVNTYYDWLAGSWWAISHEHKDWIGKTRAVINVEAMGVSGTPLRMLSNPELKPWLTRLSSAQSQYLPFGSSQVTPVFCWNDQWPFTALGIPSVMFDSSGLDDHTGAYPPRYHSSFDTQDLIDWDYLADIAKFIHSAVRELDDGLLPFNLEERGQDLANAVKRMELLAVGADPYVISSLLDALNVFQRDALAYQRGCDAIPPNKLDSLNSKLLEIERVLNVGLTALSAIDDSTIYPHQQVLADANGLKTALAALRADIPDGRTALQALESIGETILGTKFSYEVYQKLLARKHPNFQNLQWASMGKLAIPVDVMTEYRAIKSGEFTAAIATLESKHEQQIVQLNKRLQDMTTVLNRAQRPMALPCVTLLS